MGERSPCQGAVIWCPYPCGSSALMWQRQGQEKQGYPLLTYKEAPREGSIQLGLECLQEWSIHNFSGQLVPEVKNFFLPSKLNPLKSLKIY